MIVTKEWDDIVEKIYNLIGIGDIRDLELIIPESLFIEYKLNYQKKHNKKLSYKYIELKASNYCSGPKVTSIIKIKFGPKEKVDKEKKEIIVEFKYASKIVVYLVALFEPSVLKVNTIDLEERKDSFSSSLSTLDNDYAY
ncbi:MAG: hypothetical protein HWD90_02100 [Campylobacteraceae bacterium]|nr:hypothetical protein [Campylobacteraceae bacterium]